MKLIIDFDNIKDSSKKEWLLNSLRLMKIRFYTIEKLQTLTQYNKDLEKGDTEIEAGEFITATDLKREANNW